MKEVKKVQSNMIHYFGAASSQCSYIVIADKSIYQVNNFVAESIYEFKSSLSDKKKRTYLYNMLFKN
jgi:hypothetical protein